MMYAHILPSFSEMYPMFVAIRHLTVHFPTFQPITDHIYRRYPIATDIKLTVGRPCQGVILGFRSALCNVHFEGPPMVNGFKKDQGITLKLPLVTSGPSRSIL